MEDWPTWVETLRMHRKYPSMSIGWPATAHLDLPIKQALRALWEKRVYLDPVGATVSVAPRQCHVRGYSGPLVPALDELIDWETCDVLLQALLKAHRRVLHGEAGGIPGYVAMDFSFAAYTYPLFLADRGVMALRSQAGLWYQAYRHGWPVMPPTRLEQSGGSIGFMMAASLHRYGSRDFLTRSRMRKVPF